MYIVCNINEFLSSMPNINNVKPEVAVIGAGIIGVTTALQLQKAGYQVTLIDKLGIGEGCSKGNAGHFATEQVFPLADSSLLPKIPSMLLDPLGPFRISLPYLLKALPWFLKFITNMRPSAYEKNKLALRRLNLQALPAWKRILSELRMEHLIELKGSLLTFEQQSSEQALKVLALYQAEDISVQLLNRAQLEQLQPGLDARVHCALYFNEVGHTINPYLLTQTLYQECQRLGVIFKKTEVTEINHLKNQPIVSFIDAKSQSFDKLVLCTGAFSKKLCLQLGYKIPIEAERGYHLMAQAASMPKIPIASFDKKFIMTPMAEGLRLAGTVEFSGLKQPANYKRALALLPLGQAIWPAITTKLTDDNLIMWMGCRPSLPDSKPIISQSGKHQSIYFNLGHQHLGLTLAAISAQLVCELISKQKPTIELRDLYIERFK